MGYCNGYDLFVFVGLPGCGKSTLGKLLALKYKLDYFETSSLIDKAISEAKEKSQTIFGKTDYEAEKQERRKKRGENCENEFVCKQVFEKLISYSNGTVISGFPRDEEQAERFAEFIIQIGARHRCLVILPKISEKLSLQRLVKKQKELLGENFISELAELQFQGIKDDFGRVVSVLSKNRITILQIASNKTIEESISYLFSEIK